MDGYLQHTRSGVNTTILSSTITNLLTRITEASNGLQNPKVLYTFIEKWQTNQKLKAKTVLNHLSQTSKFIHYCILWHEDVMQHKGLQWEAVMAEVRESYTKAAGKDGK